MNIKYMPGLKKKNSHIFTFQFMEMKFTNSFEPSSVSPLTPSPSLASLLVHSTLKFVFYFFAFICVYIFFICIYTK